MLWYKKDIVTEKSILRTHFLDFFSLHLELFYFFWVEFWVIPLFWFEFKVILFFWVAESCARTSISCVHPPWVICKDFVEILTKLILVIGHCKNNYFGSLLVSNMILVLDIYFPCDGKRRKNSGFWKNCICPSIFNCNYHLFFEVFE